MACYYCTPRTRAHPPCGEVTLTRVTVPAAAVTSVHTPKALVPANELAGVLAWTRELSRKLRDGVHRGNWVFMDAFEGS